MKKEEFKQVGLMEYSLYLKSYIMDDYKGELKILDNLIEIYLTGGFHKLVNEEELVKRLKNKYLGDYERGKSIFKYHNSWRCDFDGSLSCSIQILCDSHSIKYGCINYPVLIIDQYLGGQCDRDGFTGIRFKTFEQLIEFIKTDDDLEEIRDKILQSLEETSKKAKKESL